MKISKNTAPETLQLRSLQPSQPSQPSMNSIARRHVCGAATSWSGYSHALATVRRAFPSPATLPLLVLLGMPSFAITFAACICLKLHRSRMLLLYTPLLTLHDERLRGIYLSIQVTCLTGSFLCPGLASSQAAGDAPITSSHRLQSASSEGATYRQHREHLSSLGGST